MSEGFDTIVIGGGIAGVSALAAVARLGSAVLLEQESSLAAHASGRNAAIYRPLEFDMTTATLARRSLEILAELTSEPILRRVGLLLVARERAEIEAAARHARELNIEHAVLDPSQCGGRVTALVGGDLSGGLLLRDAGVLDIHRMITVLAAVARDRGGLIWHGAQVAAIETLAGTVCGVRLSDGRRLSALRVVIAAGAWCTSLGRTCGSAIVLTSVRRHLIQLRPEAPIDPQTPVVWQIDPGHELYFRPESGGWLASPCDALETSPGSTQVHPDALELLAAKLSKIAPVLAKAEVQHAWACLRTFASDRELVVGPDPQVGGLYWLAGLGGRGMAVAAAAAEVLGTLVAKGQVHDLAQRLSPSRL